MKTKTTKSESTMHKIWWGNKALLILLTATSLGTFIMQIIQLRKG